MRYDQLRYVPESEDPSITIETSELVAKIIDNTGLLLPRNEERKSFFGSYGFHEFIPFTHHLGYHGIRTLYNKRERRNIVLPFASWLNLQTVQLEGIEKDPLDERAWAGDARGWPIRLERTAAGARLVLDPMPQAQMRYTIEFTPIEPDAIDFSVRFVFHRRPASGISRARFTWPCYMNAYDDVAFHYPRGTRESFAWASIGERPNVVLGDPVSYVHEQNAFFAEQQAMPLGLGRIGQRALIIMFNDLRVRFFVVNAGGHFSFSPVQNPAWDFEWIIDGYPLDEPVGFDGRLVYTKLESPQQALGRYRQWNEGQHD